MYILMIRLKIKNDYLQEFIENSIDYAKETVLSEPDCRRFDVIQDSSDPTLFALTEIYNDEAAFEAHKSYDHFLKRVKSTAHMNDSTVETSICRPVFPRGDARWDSARPCGRADDKFFDGHGLFIIHTPLYVKKDRVNDFIDAVTLDGIGSTQEESGCLRFDVYQNIEDPTELYLYEVYTNPAAFEYHCKTPHIKKWQSTVKDWYDEKRKGQGMRSGINIWPPDNWQWSSGKPIR